VSMDNDGQRNIPIPSHGHPRERPSGSCSPICSCLFGFQGGARQRIPFVCFLSSLISHQPDARDQLERVPRSSIDQSGSTVDSSDRLNRCNSLLPGSSISHLSMSCLPRFWWLLISSSSAFDDATWVWRRASEGGEKGR
jgi:hypothetical protein